MSFSGLFRFTGRTMTTTLERPMEQQTQSVIPMAGETQGQFFDRAYRALKRQFPKPNNRTVEIIRLWQQSPNDQDLRTEAQERFPTDKFTQYGPRCVFLSHTIPEIAEEVDETTGEITQAGREGTEYNRENLQHLVDYANYRIRNAGLFAALSEGHMPTLEEKATGRPDADVLGYAGPFYIGLFGNQDPQWAIFCDEWVHNEDVPKANKLQRRSPEVWCKEPIERRTMDPIAMLGSETPRLDSGMNLYLRRADGQEVMRYSMPGGTNVAMPNANNSYVPGAADKKKKSNDTLKYGANDMPFPNGGQQPPTDQNSDQNPNDVPPDAGGPDEAIVDAVVEAIAGLMPSIMQKVMDSMRQDTPNDPDAVPQDDDANGPQDAVPGDKGDPNDPGAAVPRGIEAPEIDAAGQAGNGSPPPKPEAPQQNSAQGGMPGGAQMAGQPMGNAPMGGLQGNAQPNAPAPHIDEKHAKYAAMSPECGMAYSDGHQTGCTKGKPMTTNYSKNSEALEARLIAQDKQLAAAMKRIADLEQTARDTERYAKIHAIAAAHDIGDEEEVLKEVLDASDAEFDRYCKILTKAAPKGDATMVELYDDPRLNPETENYDRRSGAKNGKSVTKDDIDHYTRLATKEVLAKRKRGVETTVDEEMKLIFEANGLPDPNLLRA